MKYFLTSLLILCGLFTLNASEEWLITTDMSFTLNQNTYSDNWAGSELGNISWVFNSHSRAEKRLSELFMWKNSLKLAFGQTHNQTSNIPGEKTWLKPEKTTDKIDLESILTMTFNQYVDPFFAFRWESQFLDLRDPNETIIINPMRFTESAGISKSFIDKEDHYLASRLGGAFRQFMDRSDFVTEEMTYDGGIEFVTEYRKMFAARGINFNSKLLLYQALYYSEEDTAPNDYWKEVDITWENTITTKIWSVINMVFNFDLIYEKEEDLKGQFRQSLGLGIAWRL